MHEPIDDEWIEDEGGDEMLVCPVCQQAVHEDTQQCPHCGDWIIPRYPGETRWRAIWGIAALLAAAGLLYIAIF